MITLPSRQEIEDKFDEFCKLNEIKVLQRDKLYQAFMNLEYMQNLEGTLHGYHPALGNFTMSAEEILTIYLNLFIVAERYKKELLRVYPSYTD